MPLPFILLYVDVVFFQSGKGHLKSYTKNLFHLHFLGFCKEFLTASAALSKNEERMFKMRFLSTMPA